MFDHVNICHKIHKNPIFFFMFRFGRTVYTDRIYITLKPCLQCLVCFVCYLPWRFGSAIKNVTQIFVLSMFIIISSSLPTNVMGRLLPEGYNI